MAIERAEKVEPAYGEFDAHGNLVKDVFTCSVTGLPTQPGDVLVKIPGTRYFYRAKAGVLNLLSDEDRATLDAGPAAPKGTQTKDGK